MRNVVCWDPRQVHAVINPEAEAVPDFVFRAVHTDQPLRVAQPVGDRFQMLSPSAYRQMGAPDLVSAFLQPERRHVQLAVLGRSGSGKSHLIHWMRLAIPPSERRMVLTIPKAGTSLRSIVEMIIDRLPGSAQAPFREALARAGDAVMTREGQKHELLNQIAQAIREDSPRQRGDDGELEQALIEHLPDLFQDAYIRREHFLREDGVVAALVDHVFAVRSEYQPAEERQRFRPDDLPFGGLDLLNASKPARDAIQVLGLQPDRTLPLAAALVNRALDGAAIARAFSFSGDRVTALMSELRRHLRREGRELVLLIEDFARLQGIDRALLQALLTQGDESLCDIRWAIAATTGFFETVADTVYTRMTFFVDMDRSPGDQRAGATAQKALARFAGRYLNAVRLGPDKLADWAAGAGADEAPLNACEVCPHRRECHQAFTPSEEGFGLYPFTSRALWNMALRADEQLEMRFNPRVLQRSVLVRVLDNYASALAAGAFPPRALLDHLGGVKHLGAVETDRLRRMVPAEQYDRVLTFQELWHGSSSLTSVPADQREVLSLPDFVGASPEPPEPPGPPGPQPPSPEPPRDPRLAQLDAWAAGGVLEQRLTTTLRELVYEAIEEAIDWDGEMLERSSFASATANRPFRQRSIHFQRQDTQAMLAQVRLTIPLAGSDEAAFARTALALQGLLLARERGGEWTFPNGMLMLAALQECLAEWSADVVRQVRALPGAREHWDPVAAATELLGIGACLSGRLTANWDLADLLSAAFAEWSDDSGAQSSELREVYRRLRSQREKLVDLVRAVASGTKGGRIGPFLNPAAVVPALQALRQRGWRLGQVPPSDGGTGDWAALARAYQEVARALEGAAEAERKVRLDWLAEMEKAFGSGARRADILASISAARDAAVAAGVGGQRVSSLRERLEQFSQVLFDDAVRAAVALRDEADALAALPRYGRGRTPAATSGRELAAATGAFLAGVEAELANQEAQFGHGEASIPGHLEAIGDALTVMSEGLMEAQP